MGFASEIAPTLVKKQTIRLTARKTNSEAFFITIKHKNDNEKTKVCIAAESAEGSKGKNVSNTRNITEWQAESL